MTAVAGIPRTRQAVPATLGADRLHAGHPGRACRRAGRPQRRRKDDPAEPCRRPARADLGHDRGPRQQPGSSPAQLARVGFVAQDTPTYAGLTVADHLRLGASLNPGWDAALARDRIDRLDLDPGQKAGKLSGGQRAQLALTLAIAKQPELLMLDEPIASLDPLARREFLQGLMESVADHERQRRAVLAPGRRPRAGLRLPDRARRLPGARLRRGRRAARHPPPAHRCPP